MSLGIWGRGQIGSVEQNLRAERPSRSLRSALVSFLLPGKELGGRGMGAAVLCEKGREVSSLRIRGPASPSPVFWALRGRRFAPGTLSMPRGSLEGDVPPKMHVLILAQLHTHVAHHGWQDLLLLLNIFSFSWDITYIKYVKSSNLKI